MNRRNALWLLLALGVAGIAAFLLARRTAPPAVAAATATARVPVPRRDPVVHGVGDLTPGVVRAPESDPAAADDASGEQPLPTWVRLAIVAGALLAFLAVSLIATKD